MAPKSHSKAAGRRSLNPFRFSKGTLDRWFSGKRPTTLGGPPKAVKVEVKPPEVSADEIAQLIAASKAEGNSGPSRGRDEQGYVVPFTEAEHQAFQEMIERLQTIHNGPEEDDREFFRAMDANRPNFPLFEGLY